MARLILAEEAQAPRLAATVLEDGGTIVLPTDTVYGIAALVTDHDAVDRLLDIKQRPPDIHLAVLVAEPGQVLRISQDRRPQVAALMRAFWPGPLTLVLPLATELVSGLGPGDGTVGVRCPDYSLARAIAFLVGPIATSSANVHGRPPATTAIEAVEQLPGVDLVIDAGPIDGGVPSTVVDLTGPDPVVLREGPVASGQVEKVWRAARD